VPPRPAKDEGDRPDQWLKKAEEVGEGAGDTDDDRRLKENPPRGSG
jgi:hypothetical protein